MLAPLARRPEPDLDVLMTYGIALAQAGQRDAARSRPSDARARSIPRAPSPPTTWGRSRSSSATRRPPARSSRRRSRLDPEMARAYGSLGVLSAVGGKAEDAERLWNASPGPESPRSGHPPQPGHAAVAPGTAGRRSALPRALPRGGSGGPLRAGHRRRSARSWAGRGRPKARSVFGYSHSVLRSACARSPPSSCCPRSA